jgi:hypothetical protein
MLPCQVQERVGQSLLRFASVDGTRRALEMAVAQARSLVFEMGSTTPFLTEKYSDLRWVITDRVENSSPVWAAVGEEFIMHRSNKQRMFVCDESHCADGSFFGVMYNTEKTAEVAAPTTLPSHKWVSSSGATLVSAYASADESVTAAAGTWVHVPEMRITAVHGLDDGEPAKAAALRQLAAVA